MTPTYIPFQPPDCMVCGDQHPPVLMTQRQWTDWKVMGRFVQDVFPNLDVDAREVLISGTHRSCWDQLMEEE